MRAQFLSPESSITCNLPVQPRFIEVNYLHRAVGGFFIVEGLSKSVDHHGWPATKNN